MFLSFAEFKNLAESPQSGDVTLISHGGVRFSVHKIVLAHASKFLAREFASQNFQCQEVEVFCNDFSPESVNKVLDLVHTGSAEFEFYEHKLLLEVSMLLMDTITLVVT